MQFEIRSFQPGDLPALLRICLLTGDAGADASALYRDPELLGTYFVAPYVAFEPDLCLVLDRDGAPCGYVLGTRDSAAFAARCERAWFPGLRQRHPLPAADDASRDARIVRLIHAGADAGTAFPAYPAHLHIDLLLVAQGQGWGRALMAAFLQRLRAAGAAGVHLHVGKSNPRAVGFYRRLGFEVLAESAQTFAFGLRLRA